MTSRLCSKETWKLEYLQQMKIVVATTCMVTVLLLLTNINRNFFRRLTSFPNQIMSSTDLHSVEFEVYGKVQGVFFRKNTVIQGKKLGLKGWCMNTEKGTVLGKMEGELGKINEMKHWLQHIGSPSSKIERAEFRNESTIKKYTFSDFSVRR